MTAVWLILLLAAAVLPPHHPDHHPWSRYLNPPSARSVDAGTGKPGKSGTPSCKDVVYGHATASALVVATSCSRGYVDRALNCVGSVQFWEPDLCIVVYGIGLRPDDVRRFESLRNVAVVPVNVTSLPPHAHMLGNYAWKTFVMDDAVHRFPHGVLILDAGIEVRSKLGAVAAAMATSGYFFVETTASVDHMPTSIRPSMATWLGVAPHVYHDRPMCYSGIVGLRLDGGHSWTTAQGHGPAPSRDSTIASLAEQLARCGRAPECISDPGASHDNSRYGTSTAVLPPVSMVTSRVPPWEAGTTNRHCRCSFASSDWCATQERSCVCQTPGACRTIPRCPTSRHHSSSAGGGSRTRFWTGCSAQPMSPREPPPCTTTAENHRVTWC